MSAANVARALGGKPNGSGFLCRCPVQSHGRGRGDRTPSLSVVDGDTRLLVRCFTGCAPGDVLDELRRRGLLDDARQLRGGAPPRPAPIVPDDAERIAAALRIWGEARDVRGTAGWTYLFNRGVDLAGLPDRIDGALRWHPGCPWEGGRHPCLIALWSDTRTNAPRAIHRRPITGAGEADAHWRALGPTAGAVVRLWPDDVVSTGLVIAEGIETAFVAATRVEHKGTLLRPMWAAGDAGHIAAFPALPGIEALTVVVDADDAGRRAAAECSRQWTAAGCEVTRLTPRIEGADFANLMEIAA